MFAHLNPHNSDFGGICGLYSPFLQWRLRCTHTMRSFTFVSVVVCVARKLRPCPSYSRRRDRINLGFWRSLYKGGGVQRYALREYRTRSACAGSIGVVPRSQPSVKRGRLLPRAVLKNPDFCFFLRTALATTNRQPPPTDHRWALKSRRSHDHEAESVPVNLRFCWRYEPFFLFHF